jgi:hypothetical protein
LQKWLKFEGVSEITQKKKEEEGAGHLRGKRMRKVVMVRGVLVGVEAGERINKNLEKVDLRERAG